MTTFSKAVATTRRAGTTARRAGGVSHSWTHVARRTPRPGFTLIELLVVISIILVLGAMVMAVSLRSTDKPRDGADRLQGWLLMAKQWALRDQAPRGLRLSGAGGFVTRLSYCEQSDDWTGANSSVSYTAGTPIVTGIPGFLPDYSGGFSPAGASWDARWPVGPGDMIEMDSGSNAQVAVIASAPVPTTSTLTLNPPLPTSNFSGMNYRIIRQARPRVGEAAMELPRDVAIDLNTNTTYSRPPTGATIDILFAPSGSVIGPWGTDLKLWVRDTTVAGGEQYIVTITIRTGMISVHPVAPGANPYLYTQDGRSSGL